MLVYGAGSGMGKSTLALRLVEALASRGVSARLLREETPLEEPALAPYVREIRAGRGDDPGILLEAFRSFIEKLSSDGAPVLVLDSLLPGWDWLVSAGARDEEVDRFTRALCDALAPVTPLLVLVEGDLERALARAIRDRGEDWARRLAQQRAGRADRQALLGYFRRLRAGGERALRSWVHPVLRVDTGELDLDAVLERVLSEVPLAGAQRRPAERDSAERSSSRSRRGG